MSFRNNYRIINDDYSIIRLVTELLRSIEIYIAAKNVPGLYLNCTLERFQEDSSRLKWEISGNNGGEQGMRGTRHNRNIDKPVIYEIKLQGHLDKSWSSWLEGMNITYEDGHTILTGEMTDQASLRGLLNKVWDMNQTLISICPVETSGN